MAQIQNFFDVNAFSKAFQNGGLRASLFCVDMDIPTALEQVLGNDVTDSLRYNIRSTSVPSASVGKIGIPFMGRTINVSGDRTYSDWSVTVLNDEINGGGTTRRIFEAWNQCLNTPAGNIKTRPYKIDRTDTNDCYKTDAVVSLLAKWGGIQETYVIHGIFPYDLPAFNLDWGSTDSVIEFDVTFAMDYWTNRGDTLNYSPSEPLPYMSDVDSIISETV